MKTNKLSLSHAVVRLCNWQRSNVLADWAKNPDKAPIFENPPGQRPKKRTCPGKPGRMVTLYNILVITELLQISDDWTEALELGGRIDVIYTDFEKAFDKVPHRRLLSKLKSYKIHHTIIKWIKNFLSGSKQRVRVDGEFSCWADVLSGIPQGSILGPLLFIIFINDLVDFCEINPKLYLFADDAKLYCHIKDILDLDYLQRSTDNLAKWTKRWQVTLNIRKCKVMSVHHRRYSDDGAIPNYVINNIRLDEVEEIKDLGLTYDSLLLFDKHISEKVNKAYMMWV